MGCAALNVYAWKMHITGEMSLKNCESRVFRFDPAIEVKSELRKNIFIWRSFELDNYSIHDNVRIKLYHHYKGPFQKSVLLSGSPYCNNQRRNFLINILPWGKSSHFPRAFASHVTVCDMMSLHFDVILVIFKYRVTSGVPWCCQATVVLPANSSIVFLDFDIIRHTRAVISQHAQCTPCVYWVQWEFLFCVYLFCGFYMIDWYNLSMQKWWRA